MLRICTRLNAWGEVEAIHVLKLWWTEEREAARVGGTWVTGRPHTESGKPW